MKRTLLLLISLFTICGFIFASNGKFVVVIDAGHGGKDPGAVRGKYKEKDINLGVALELGRLLEKNMSDVKVVYTRKNDTFVDLDVRAQIANKAKANLFISIHTNATDAKSTSASGADTYILGLARSAENLAVAKRENSVILYEDNYKTKYEGFDPNKPESNIIFEFMTNKYMEQSLQFAEHVQKNFKEIARRVDRGVRQAGFLVLRKTSTPCVLIELGFINNDTEARYLSSNLGQRAMATSIYSGIRKYKLEFDKKQGIVRKQPANEAVEIVDEVVVDVIETPIIETDTPKTEPVITQQLKAEPVKIEPKQSKPIVQETTKTEQPQKSPTKAATTKETSKPTIKTNETEYRVQFLVSDRKLPASSTQFKGLSPVGYYKDGNSYKYTYGSTTDGDEIQRIQKQVRTKFKDAFVVKFKNGARIK